jgi:hypothetical protein
MSMFSVYSFRRTVIQGKQIINIGEETKIREQDITQVGRGRWVDADARNFVLIRTLDNKEFTTDKVKSLPHEFKRYLRKRLPRLVDGNPKGTWIEAWHRVGKTCDLCESGGFHGTHHPSQRTSPR